MKTYDERAKDLLEKRDGVIAVKAAKRKKAARLGVIAAVLALAVMIPVIAVIASRANAKPPVAAEDDTTVAGTVKTPDKEPESTGYNDGVIGENKGGYSYDADSAEVGLYPEVIKGDPSSRYDEAEKMPAPSEVEVNYDKAYEVNGPAPKAGLLSAGEWKDAANLDEWLKLCKNESWSGYVKERSLDTTNVITVKVTDKGAACFNVPVRLMSGENTLYNAVTGVDGCALLFYNIDKNGEQPDSVLVGGKSYRLDGKTIEAEAEDAGIKVSALDLLLMIDTTGSMGDELEYLKTELEDVVSRVAQNGENLSIRVSVNFYRDEGDEYVVKYYDFRTDINEVTKQLREQTADGGGDWPEAVHTALENAVTGHNWRADAVKLCFFVLDAPPHSEYEIQGINENLLKSIKAAAEQGIRIIPVASSGVDGGTEFLLRSWSLMTGGTYIFLTNHSHIGGDHKEAEVGEHTVEYLNECMIRVISEYCGIYSGEKVPYTPPHQVGYQQ